MLLIDTNTIIHYIKGNPGVLTRFHESSPGELCVPSIVVYELEQGSLNTRSTKRRGLVSSVLHDLEVIPFDGDTAVEAARIHFELAAKGLLIGSMDLLIAGIVRFHRATLVTNNTKEFSRVKGLKIVDWRT